MGVPHDVQGAALYAFVTLTRGAGAQSRDGCGAIVAAADAVAPVGDDLHLRPQDLD